MNVATILQCGTRTHRDVRPLRLLPRTSSSRTAHYSLPPRYMVFRQLKSNSSWLFNRPSRHLIDPEGFESTAMRDANHHYPSSCLVASLHCAPFTAAPSPVTYINLVLVTWRASIAAWTLTPLKGSMPGPYLRCISRSSPVFLLHLVRAWRRVSYPETSPSGLVPPCTSLSRTVRLEDG